MSALEVVILAAGQGTRMQSSLPKVMHPVGGVPMIERVVNTAQTLNATKIIVVYGNGGELLPEKMAHLPVTWVRQEQQLGTGHAVQQALPELSQSAQVLILYADVPMIKLQTLQQITDQKLTVVTANFADPTGLGRIVRNDDGQVTAIVEHKDADETTRAITEINSGIIATQAQLLLQWLPQLSNNNAQQEFYLTDIIKMAVAQGMTVNTVSASEDEVRGINDRKELAVMERILQLLHAEQLLEQGVTLLDSARFDQRGTITVGRDVVIDINCIFEGDVELGDNTTIGANCIIRDAKMGANVTIKPNSIIEQTVVDDGCVIGPFARCRPNTHLKANARIGNFVETKNATFGEGSKANHLSYVGDATIGKQVNIGAGTITCNYDGINKHHTTIEDNAFIGSDTQLIAPVTVGANAVVGAGSTITKDAPADKLTIARSLQTTIDDWERPNSSSWTPIQDPGQKP